MSRLASDHVAYPSERITSLADAARPDRISLLAALVLAACGGDVSEPPGSGNPLDTLLSLDKSTCVQGFCQFVVEELGMCMVPWGCASGGCNKSKG